MGVMVNSVKSKWNAVVAENGDYPKVKEVVEQFIIGMLDKIAEGAQEAAKGATGTSSELIGSAIKILVLRLPKRIP